MIDLAEYKTLEESFHAGKWQFWKSVYLVIKGMFKWKRFVLIYTDLERSDKDYDLHIYWYGLNSYGVRKAILDILETENSLDKTAKKAKEILDKCD